MSNQGRIWVLYDTTHDNLMVIEQHLQFIHCKITWGEETIFWTCVYGSYNSTVIREMWRELTRIGIDLQAPWLIQGDFNSVSSNEDRIGGIPINKEAASEFQNWILGLNLVEVQSSGPRFTWTNYQEGERRIYRKLDWCFSNQAFYSRKKDLVCSIVSNCISDHCGILVDIHGSKENIKSPFRFFNMWCDHPNFFAIIERIWNTPIRGSHMYRVYCRLELLRTELKCLNKRDFADISRRVSICKQNLEGIRSMLLSDLFNVGMQKEEANLICQLQKLLNWEESLLKQKARCQWVHAGDQNSKFFFRLLQQRKTRNNINQLILSNGDICIDRNEIKDAIVAYFQDFLGTSKAREGCFDRSGFHEKIVVVGDGVLLCQMPTGKEIKEALWSIKDNKCPGPDGFNSYFFKKTWNILVRRFFLQFRSFFF